MQKSKLKSIVIFTRQLSKTQDFMTDILSLKLLHGTDSYAELTDGSARFMLRAAPTLAHASMGYSPMLNFEIDDIDELVKRAKDEYDAQLDGDVAEDDYLKFACLRTPCGLSISLQQTLQLDETERKFEELILK